MTHFPENRNAYERKASGLELETSVSVGTSLLALVGVLAKSQLLLELAAELAV